MKILIVEDEERAAKRLEKIIKELDASIEVLAQLDSVESVVEWFVTNDAPELVFMDIHLADGSAFEIFNQIKISQPIIFTTAYDEYAIQAFKVNAIDYLLKPIKKEEIKIALEKFKSSQTQNIFNYQDLAKLLHKGETKKLKRFLIRVGQTLKTVEVNNVAYFYTEDKITFLISNEGKRYPIDYSLEKLEDELDKEIFFRINRQFIVRVSAITKMVTVSKSRVKLYLEPSSSETIVSTERSGKFKRWLVGEDS
jgi:two-component system LytT family response regulator